MTHNEDRQPRILIMDGNERNAELISEFIASQGYDPVAVTDLDAADEVFSETTDPAFAIVDLDRFGSTVWKYCKQLHDRAIPFIVLSGLRDQSLRQQSHNQGSRSFIEKPIPKQDLLNLLQNAIDN